ncbi:hypothetical protein C0Q70_12881 [Pomacea canaliculata]|uniref:Ig-like domain-containing protein n=1 Tax=Pomacea canaliculata TaxID=400727 RepID=A0A2T7P2S8_POMCA|nr:hypothetical protein C0Q70_12881 [Pomacea canaliculata]
MLLTKVKWENAFNLSIDDPGELTMKNCKHEVSEGDEVVCACSTQHEGNPPPVISWVGQTTSSTLHLYDVTGEDNKTYTCEMIWGNQTKTVSYSLIVRGRSETQQSAKNKEQGILSQHSSSYSGHGEDELIENRYYGGFDIVDGGDFKNVGDDYAEVMEAKSVEPDLYTGIEENNGRQTTEPIRYVEANKGRQAAQVEVYACVEKNKERQPIQPELYATVVKFSGKEQSKTDNSRLQKDFANEENVYTIVDKGAKPESHALSAPIEEMYAQVVKSPK